MMLMAMIDWHAMFFWLFALIAIIFSVGVLVSTNIVRMAFYLVLSLGATAGLFFLAGAEFVGAMQLMIYVGGTLVLLIFGVMLTAQARFISLKTNAGDWVLAVAAGGALLMMLVYTAFSVEGWSQPRADRAELSMVDSKATGEVSAGLVGVRVDKLAEDNPVLRAGMSGYLFPFVIISIHLLVVLIGAAYMARTKKRATPAAVT